ncbi:hypothetical protein L218DRAFT_950630 [Marasmius fiardii PR-910]|nr:hypothetical protein L218DRAFT_950630 [Marasmius fiardii PR-910]
MYVNTYLQPVENSRLVMEEGAPRAKTYQLHQARVLQKFRLRLKDLNNNPPNRYMEDAVQEEVRELLTRIRGEEGDLARKHAEKLSEEISNIWKEDGEAMVEIEGFLKKYVDSQ